MSDKPNLGEIIFRFSQEGNCVDSKSDEYENIEIKAISSLGLDFDDGAFFVIKTKQWAFNDVQEFSEMIQRVQDAVDAALKNNPYRK
jgi:hypothetical protein